MNVYGTDPNDEDTDADGLIDGDRVHVVYGFGQGQTAVPGCPGLSVDIAGAGVLGLAWADGAGNAQLSRSAPASVLGTQVFFQAVELGACRVSDVRPVVFQ